MRIFFHVSVMRIWEKKLLHFPKNYVTLWGENTLYSPKKYVYIFSEFWEEIWQTLPGHNNLGYIKYTGRNFIL